MHMHSRGGSAGRAGVMYSVYGVYRPLVFACLLYLLHSLVAAPYCPSNLEFQITINFTLVRSSFY
jgi:hypothetical protein